MAFFVCKYKCLFPRGVGRGLGGRNGTQRKINIFELFSLIFCNQLFLTLSNLCKKQKELLNNEAKGGKLRMQNVKRKLELAFINAKNKVLAKKEGSDQLMVMFIIIAVAAGVAGLLYIFAKSTLLPEFQSKVSELINNWFNHA